LAELAIVVGIIALILAAIWAAVAQVTQSNQIRRAQQELAVIAQNVRSAFADQPGAIGARVNLTTALDKMRVFPTDMRKNPGTASGILFAPWSQQLITLSSPDGEGNSGPLGTVQIFGSQCSCTAGYGSEYGTANPGAQPCFTIMMAEVIPPLCAQLAIATSQNSSGGLAAICSRLDAHPLGTAAAGTLPVSAATAATECTSSAYTSGAPGVRYSLFWVYQIKDTP